MSQVKPPLNSVFNRWSYGNAGLTSKTVFQERVLYDSIVFPNLVISNFFDFWDEDRLYGRVNPKGSAVYTRESYLKQLKYAAENETHFAVNFVADAWRDFCDRIRQLKNNNIIQDSGPYADMTASKSWRSASAEYHNYMTNILFPVFSDIFMSLAERENSVKNFGTFLDTFTEFSDTILNEVGPLTFSGFLESGITSPFSTGLVIEISYDDHNDDFNKLKTFFYDDNFPLIVDLCTQYGFSIDKNAPWRFVADIGNEAMQEYIYGLPMEGAEPLNINGLTDCEEPIINDDLNQSVEPFTYSQVLGLEGVIRHSPGYRPYRLSQTTGFANSPYENVFGTAYRDPYELDMLFLQAYLLDFYNRHIIKKPFYEEEPSSANVCNPGAKIIKERRQEGPEVYSVYSDRWSLKTYYLLRCKEKKYQKTTAEKTKDYRKISSIYDLISGSPEQKFNGALRYIRENILVERVSSQSTVY